MDNSARWKKARIFAYHIRWDQSKERYNMVGGILDEMVGHLLEKQGIQEKAKKRHSAQVIRLQVGINEHAVIWIILHKLYYIIYNLQRFTRCLNFWCRNVLERVKNVMHLLRKCTFGADLCLNNWVVIIVPRICTKNAHLNNLKCRKNAISEAKNKSRVKIAVSVY